MNTQHLKYAIEVERTGSISQAAENLYVGQPSLSKAIKDLEESLGIEIFKRTSKGAVPTERGAEFLKYARNVMAQVEKMESLALPGNPHRQSFSLSITRSGYMALAAAEFIASLDAEKELEAEVRETESIQVIEDVAQIRAGMGVIRYRLRDEAYFLDYLSSLGLKHEPVWEFDRMITFSHRHPLAERVSLRAEALFPYIEVKMGNEATPYVQGRELPRPDSREDKWLKVYDRMNLMEMLAHVPSAYAWAAPIPEEILSARGLVQRDCPLPENRYRDALIYAQGHEFTPVEKRFINKLYEYKNRLAF